MSIDIDLAEHYGIPSCADAQGCDRTDRPGRKEFDMGYGLAGGGFGTYLYCGICQKIAEDCDDES